MLQSYPTYCLNLNGKILDLSGPKVMGILNITPDSFYAGSRVQTGKEIQKRVEQFMAEGAHLLDIGACSTRPGARETTQEEEMARLRSSLPFIRKQFPQAIMSVDTYRAEVARMCVQEYGVDLINDISGGSLDAEMFQTVAQLKVPYILTHPGSIPRTCPDPMQEVCTYFQTRIARLQESGVKDIVLDPGFGFGKNLEQNYQLLARLEELHRFHLPLLAGLSRKSMIYQPLGIVPEEALNGTTVLHTVALLKGVHILRVHDVKACVEAITLTQTLRNTHV